MSVSTTVPSVANSTENSTQLSSEKDPPDYTYVILTAVVSCMSMAGCVGLIAFYFYHKQMRTPGRKLLAFLCVADFLTAAGNLLGVIWYIYRDSAVIHKSMAYCRFQSALTVFSSISSFAWNVVIGASLVATIVLNKTLFIEKYQKLFHVICWVFPGFIAALALSMGVLGYDQSLDQASWCWVDPRVPYSLLWNFITGKFWEIIAYITVVVLYSIVKAYIVRKTKNSLVNKKGNKKNSQMLAATAKLTFVPLVFIVLRIWGTVRFLLGVLAHDYASSPDSQWIVPLQGIGDSGQGFANFMLYCFTTERVRMTIFFCFRGNRVEHGSTTTDQSGHSTSDKKQTKSTNAPV